MAQFKCRYPACGRKFSMSRGRGRHESSAHGMVKGQLTVDGVPDLIEGPGDLSVLPVPDGVPDADLKHLKRSVRANLGGLLAQLDKRRGILLQMLAMLEEVEAE